MLGFLLVLINQIISLTLEVKKPESLIAPSTKLILKWVAVNETS